jgi:hypothetical protein
MTGRRTTGDDARYQVRGVDAPRAPGLHLGRIRVTPARMFLLVALAGGLGFLGYSVAVRDQLQIPLMASGFAICGLVFAVASLMGVAAVVRAGRDGRDAAAVLTALVAGVLAFAAFMSLAAAIVMSLIWSGTSAS